MRTHRYLQQVVEELKLSPDTILYRCEVAFWYVSHLDVFHVASLINQGTDL